VLNASRLDCIHDAQRFKRVTVHFQHKLAEASLSIDKGHVPVHDEVGLVVSRMGLEAVAPDFDVAVEHVGHLDLLTVPTHVEEDAPAYRVRDGAAHQYFSTVWVALDRRGDSNEDTSMPRTAGDGAGDAPVVTKVFVVHGRRWRDNELAALPLLASQQILN
jgi:hypothetical protein